MKVLEVVGIVLSAGIVLALIIYFIIHNRNAYAKLK